MWRRRENQRWRLFLFCSNGLTALDQAAAIRAFVEPKCKPKPFVARRLNRTASQTVIISDNLPVHALSPEPARRI
jgi:hypothetical protein